MMLDLLSANVEHRLMRDAAISGLKGRELSFLAKLARDWPDNTPGREAVIRQLAECVAQSREASAINQLLDLLAGSGSRWQQYAMIDGINGLIPKGRARGNAPPKPLRLAGEPAGLAKLKALADAGIQSRLTIMADLLVWPGKPGYNEPQVTPLTVEEKQRFDAGQAQYVVICGACHQPTGLGQEGLAPPLVDSEWANGSPERIVRIVLNGLRGKVNVKGKTWELEMPQLNILPDEDIANLLTYIRREWGHTASPVAPEFVAKIRAATSQRESAWTEPELLRVK
jgi:mono/diheme cytochrome c family protein